MTSFYPATGPRATSQLGITRLLFQINHDQLAIQDLQTQISTGRKLSVPSQDPAAAIRALAAQRQQEFKSQVLNNLQSADTILAATESTLSQSQAILTEMRGVAVQASGNTLSAEERDALLSQIEAAISKLTDLGNSKFRDQYIFGGSAVEAAPLKSVGDSVRFSGNAEELKTISDYSATIAANVTGNDAFGVKSSKVVSTVDLNPSIAADTPLSQLNRADGVRRGAISISNGVSLVEIDLASAHNLDDVLAKINSTALGSRSLVATLGANRLNISYADGSGGLLRIEDVGSGRMAADLGIDNSNTAGLSPVIGSDLDPVVTPQTRLSRLFAGTGITIGDSFQITQGARTFGISTTGLSTIEDLINRIHQSGVQAQASLDSSWPLPADPKHGKWHLLDHWRNRWQLGHSPRLTHHGSHYTRQRTQFRTRDFHATGG
jgi:flagellar hook-associated protein 3 FlgL